MILTCPNGNNFIVIWLLQVIHYCYRLYIKSHLVIHNCMPSDEYALVQYWDRFITKYIHTIVIFGAHVLMSVHWSHDFDLCWTCVVH